MSLKNLFFPKFMRKYIEYYKEYGLKKTIKDHGWRLFVIVFFFYLVRDGLLYIIIPYFAAKGIFNF